MTWGVVAAVVPELGATLRALGARRHRDGDRTFYVAAPFVFAAAGVGEARAARCAADLLERFHPRVLVSTGFAGALARDLQTGTIVLGGVPGLAASDGPLREARVAGPLARAGEIVTAARVLLGETETASAAQASGAIAVDMESVAVGRVARERGVGFLCVKSVLDTPLAPLASRYESLPRVLGEILRRPAILPAILADGRRARTAGRNLADFYRALAAVLVA